MCGPGTTSEVFEGMAKTTIRRSYRGRAEEPVNWNALLQIFDAIWGKSNRSLPKFPQTVGAIHAVWRDALDAEYEADHIDEVGQAYQQRKTAFISFTGFFQRVPRCDFRYWPAKAEASIDIKAGDQETAEQIIAVVRQEFPLVAKYVYISHDTAEIDLATYVAKVLEKRLVPGVSVFIAKRDIKPGANWLKVMLNEQLLHAEALVALCSAKSKASPWLWWESSAVWARRGLVVPLFVDISPSQFDGPITLVCQGRCFFEVKDMNSTLRAVVSKVCPAHSCKELTLEEVAELDRLRSGSSK